MTGNQSQNYIKSPVLVVEARHLMNKLLVIFVLFSITTIGLSYSVSADGFEYKEPFESQKSGCTLITNSDNLKRWECYGEWRSADYIDPAGELTAPSEDGCPSGLDIDITTGECRPFEDIAEEAKEEYFKSLVNPEPEVNPKLPDANSDRATDKELIKKINNILAAEDPRCYQGFGTTTGVQQVRDFSIPVHTITRDGKTFVELDTSVPRGAMNYGGLLKEILTHGQECKAQMILNNIQGGVLSSQDYQSGFCDVHSKDLSIEESVQAGCGMSSGAFYNNLHATVPEWSQARTSQESNFGIDMSNNRYDIVEDICEGYYTNTYKMTFKECRDIRDSKVELSGGHIPSTEIQNDAEDKMLQYLKDGGASQAKELREKTIQKKISQLMKQMQTLRDSQK